MNVSVFLFFLLWDVVLVLLHFLRRLKRDGNHVVVADWKRNEFMAEPEFCDEFHLVDLRELSNCIK